MGCLFILFSPLLLALSANSLSILLPLYIYPDLSASGWKPVFDVIRGCPTVKWLVILRMGVLLIETDYLASLGDVRS